MCKLRSPLGMFKLVSLKAAPNRGVWVFFILRNPWPITAFYRNLANHCHNPNYPSLLQTKTTITKIMTDHLSEPQPPPHKKLRTNQPTPSPPPTPTTPFAAIKKTIDKRGEAIQRARQGRSCLNSATLQIAERNTHTSHSLFQKWGVICCGTCGCYTTASLKKLAKECRGKAKKNSRGQKNLEAIRAGNPPGILTEWPLGEFDSPPPGPL